jgi:hypothetical protein
VNTPHPNTVVRERQEKLGGWLPVYIEAEPCVVSGATFRCFYCGFGNKEGHDFACRYLWNVSDLPTRGKEGTKDHIILVPKGGVPPSKSMF